MAKDIAEYRGMDHLSTGHMLLAIVGHPAATPHWKNWQGISPKTAAVIAALGTTAEAIIGQTVPVLTFGSGPVPRHLPFTPNLKQALEYALRSSMILGDNHIGPEHLLAGLARNRSGMAGAVLSRLGITDLKVHSAIQDSTPAPPPTAERTCDVYLPAASPSSRTARRSTRRPFWTRSPSLPVSGTQESSPPKSSTPKAELLSRLYPSGYGRRQGQTEIGGGPALGCCETCRSLSPVAPEICVRAGASSAFGLALYQRLCAFNQSKAGLPRIAARVGPTAIRIFAAGPRRSLDTNLKYARRRSDSDGAVLVSDDTAHLSGAADRGTP
ncbi:hypothetical protein TV39_08965 [Arthrobacter sp. SPG23]|nr:hypothetical protein TV39_08965 [Arthrobacter sp. SPG23]